MYKLLIACTVLVVDVLVLVFTLIGITALLISLIAIVSDWIINLMEDK